MAEPEVGQSFPEGVAFNYVPYSAETKEVAACGLPVKFNASEEFKDKKVVIVAVPGAFTPTCQERHLTSYLENKSKLKEKGIDYVVVIAGNDQWVMSAWGKANGVTDNYILFMSDPGLAFSNSLGWANGDRALRYAILVDHGKVLYAEKDVPKSIDLSGAEAILAKL